MLQEDYDAIKRALTELGIAIVFGVEQWTYDQRLMYEKATQALIKYRKEDGNSGEA